MGYLYELIKIKVQFATLLVKYEKLSLKVGYL